MILAVPHMLMRAWPWRNPLLHCVLHFATIERMLGCDLTECMALRLNDFIVVLLYVSVMYKRTTMKSFSTECGNVC
jgi:hypothetical protein